MEFISQARKLIYNVRIQEKEKAKEKGGPKKRCKLPTTNKEQKACALRSFVKRWWPLSHQVSSAHREHGMRIRCFWGKEAIKTIDLPVGGK